MASDIQQARKATARGAADVYLAHRIRYLPGQLEDTRRKFVGLLREARRYGLENLVNDAWDKALTEAQADAKAHGGSFGFRDGQQ